MKSSQLPPNCDFPMKRSPPLFTPTSNFGTTKLLNSTDTVLSRALNNAALLTPLKAPKSYGTYSKQQQEQVIAFIKDGNSLRTAERLFGIPKSTMHCWLKKINQDDTSPTMSDLPTGYNGMDESKSSTVKTTDDDKASILVPTTKSARTTGRSNKTPSPPLPIKVDKPRTQIIIEEAELIRFLQTDEGVELISKAYGIAGEDFKEFVDKARASQIGKLRGVLIAPGQNRKVEVLGFVKHQAPDSKSAMNRKRGLENGVFHGNSMETNIQAAVDNKKIKQETGEEPSLVSLLKANNNKYRQNFQKNLVLTPQQLLAASKLISEAGVGCVNTYLTTKPVLVPTSLNLPFNTICNNNMEDQKPILIQETAELSPTYPKITNPVSVKAEHTDLDTLVVPPDMTYNTDRKVLGKTPVFSRLVNVVTRPTISSNTSAAMNLNEINRTQSEKELMALVDENVISADELCAEFNETLELSNWVDNETWYADQYMQHFQVSPANTIASATTTVDMLSSPMLSSTSEMESEQEDNGLTFSTDKKFSANSKKDQIISFLSKGNTITSAALRFSIPKQTIQSWLAASEIDDNLSSDVDEKPLIKNDRGSIKFESAFYKPIDTSRKNTQRPSTSINARSAFCKSLI